MSSVFDFGEDTDLDDFSSDEAVGSVVVVFDLILLEASFTSGVAPGIDDSVLTSVVGDKGTSGSLGNLFVYNTLAGLLHRTNRCN